MMKLLEKRKVKSVLVSKWRLIATIALISVFFIKSIIFSSSILFNSQYISDEIYYVSAGKYFMYKLGVLSEFKPPVLVKTVTVNGTVAFDCTPLESEAIGVTIHAVTYNWANIEHPAFAKIIYGALIYALGKLALLRITLLIFSSIIFAFFFYTIISKYNLLGVVSIALFFALDGVVHHFMYLAFLDTLMLTFLILSITMFLRGNKYAVLPLAFAAASKEVAVIFTIPFSLLLFIRKEIKWVFIYFLITTCMCAFSFMLNIVAANLSQIIEVIIEMSRISDPHACKNLCLFSLRENWGMLTLYPVLLWLWFIGVVIKIKEKSIRDVWLLPYFLSLTNISFVALVSLLRSVYIFYYVPALSLSPIIIADVTKYLITRIFLLYRKLKIFQLEKVTI